MAGRAGVVVLLQSPFVPVVLLGPLENDDLLVVGQAQVVNTDPMVLDVGEESFTRADGRLPGGTEYALVAHVLLHKRHLRGRQAVQDGRESLTVGDGPVAAPAPQDGVGAGDGDAALAAGQLVVHEVADDSRHGGLEGPLVGLFPLSLAETKVLLVVLHLVEDISDDNLHPVGSREAIGVEGAVPGWRVVALRVLDRVLCRRLVHLIPPQHGRPAPGDP